MSTQIYLFRTEIFSVKIKPFQYLLHTLFLQNCEYLLKNELSLSTFLDFVYYEIFVKAEKKKNREISLPTTRNFHKINKRSKNFSKAFQKLRKPPIFTILWKNMEKKMNFMKLFK